jgi:hypothetical protein
MLKSVGSSVQNKEIRTSLVHDYIIYMLEPDDSGNLRYRRYDAEKYPDIPYYKWFLVKLRYYMLKNVGKMFKDYSILESLKHCQRYCNSQWYLNQDAIYRLKEADSFLEAYSNETKTSFGKSAYVLFIYKIEGHNNIEISKMLGVNKSTITKWLYKLKKLLRNNTDFDKNMIKLL